VIRAAEVAHLWAELSFLYSRYEEYDNAALTMMEHAEDSFEHAAFKDIIVRVSNLEIYYKSLYFYLEQQPLLLNDLLVVLTPRIDHGRVVALFTKLNHLPLIKPYLIAAQKANHPAINTALHELYIEEEDIRGLRDSIDHFDRFDAMELALKLEKNPALEYRRVAAHLYKNLKRYRESLALSKRDGCYKDAMETAHASRDPAVAKELLVHFIEGKQLDAFTSALYVCYDLLKPDVVLELAWRHKLQDFAMPYFIQTMAEMGTRLEGLEKQCAEKRTGEDQGKGRLCGCVAVCTWV
jgi:clathrin heavy chain